MTKLIEDTGHTESSECGSISTKSPSPDLSASAGHQLVCESARRLRARPELGKPSPNSNSAAFRFVFYFQACFCALFAFLLFASQFSFSYVAQATCCQGRFRHQILETCCQAGETQIRVYKPNRLNGTSTFKP